MRSPAAGETDGTAATIANILIVRYWLGKLALEAFKFHDLNFARE
jgi:hypothetical protein